MPKPTFFNLPEDKRQRLIDAAVDEFATVPYAKANLDNIVAAAGISKGSLYQYFGGKADLYRWLLTEHMTQKKLEAIGAAAPPAGSSIWEVLETTFLTGVRFAAAHPKLSQLGVRFLRDHELEPDLVAVAEANKAMADAWLLGLLEQAVARGEIREDADLPLVADYLGHALGEGVLQQLARLLDLTLNDLLNEPTATQRLTDDQLVDLVRRVTGLFKKGISA